MHRWHRHAASARHQLPVCHAPCFHTTHREVTADRTVVSNNYATDCVTHGRRGRRRVPAILSEPVSIDAIALFHYLTKSKAEFRAKMARGGGGGTHRKWEQFESIRRCGPWPLPWPASPMPRVRRRTRTRPAHARTEAQRLRCRALQGAALQQVAGEAAVAEPDTYVRAGTRLRVASARCPRSEQSSAATPAALSCHRALLLRATSTSRTTCVSTASLGVSRRL